MGTLDLGMDDEAEAERRRLEEERRRRRAAEGLETASEGEDDLREARRAALRDLAGMPEPGTHARAMEDATRDQAPPGQGHQMTRTPVFTDAERERIGGVEARLRAGDRAEVERDTMRDQRGTATPVRDAESEFRDEPPAAPEAPRPAVARPVQRASGLTSPIAAAQRAKPAELPRPTGADALDAGLPSEADIGGARDVDVIRRILHAIGAGMLGYTGRQAPAFRSNADALQQRRDAGMRERMGQKREDVERQDATALRTAQMDAEQQDRAQQRQIQDSQLDIQRQRLGLSQRQVDAEIAESERTRSADAEMDDAASASSQRERAALAVRLSQISPAQRQEALAQIGGSEGITGLTGREARAIIEQLARPVQPRGTALRGGGMASGQRREADESLRAAAREMGVPEAVAATAPVAELRREMLTRSRPQRGRGAAGSGSAQPDASTLVTGYRRRDDGSAPDLDAPTMRTVRQTAANASSMLRQLAELERLASEIGAMERAGGRLGEVSDRLAYARALHEDVINRLRDVGNYGVPTGTELQRMEALAPSLESVQGFLRAAPSYRGIAQASRSGTRQWMHDYGYEIDEGGESRGGGRPVPRETPREATRDRSGNVVMYGPDGPRRVPPEMVEQREAMGWTYEPQGGR